MSTMRIAITTTKVVEAMGFWIAAFIITGLFT